jgi:nitroreductase
LSTTISDIIERRSIRAYENQQIPRDVLELLVKAGKYAASGANAQAWHFTVVQNRDVINRITETLKASSRHPDIPEFFTEKVTKPEYTVNYGAPAFIIISGNAEISTVINDCSLAAGNIMLAAHSLKLGSCWINQLGIVCGVPEKYKVYASVCVGYPARTAPVAPERLENVANFIE